MFLQSDNATSYVQSENVTFKCSWIIFGFSRNYPQGGRNTDGGDNFESAKSGKT
jgi:hypothetical protein